MRYKVKIDAKQCNTLTNFLRVIGIAFKFPDYYGMNVNAFWDCIRDLSWLNADNFSLTIQNSEYFLIRENEATRKEIFDLLDEVRADWAGVPNVDGEDSFRQKAEFEIEWQPN